MSITMDIPPREMSISALAQRADLEIHKYRRKEPSDEQYCLEILRRAMIDSNSDAWTPLMLLFGDNLRFWFRNHPNRDIAQRYGQEDDYVADAFKRFWQAVTREQRSFTSLGAVLAYLKLCLSSTIMDTLRSYARPAESPLPDYEQAEPSLWAVQDSYDDGELWKAINSILRTKREQRVAYLLFHCNLTPRDIVHYCPDEFSDVNEIYTYRRNIMERIARNIEQLRWKLSDEEI